MYPLLTIILKYIYAQLMLIPYQHNTFIGKTYITYWEINTYKKQVIGTIIFYKSVGSHSHSLRMGFIDTLVHIFFILE